MSSYKTMSLILALVLIASTALSAVKLNITTVKSLDGRLDAISLVDIDSDGLKELVLAETIDSASKVYGYENGEKWSWENDEYYMTDIQGFGTRDNPFIALIGKPYVNVQQNMLFLLKASGEIPVEWTFESNPDYLNGFVLKGSNTVMGFTQADDDPEEEIVTLTSFKHVNIMNSDRKHKWNYLPAFETDLPLSNNLVIVRSKEGKYSIAAGMDDFIAFFKVEDGHQKKHYLKDNNVQAITSLAYINSKYVLVVSTDKGLVALETDNLEELEQDWTKEEEDITRIISANLLGDSTDEIIALTNTGLAVYDYKGSLKAKRSIGRVLNAGVVTLEGEKYVLANTINRIFLLSADLGIIEEKPFTEIGPSLVSGSLYFSSAGKLMSATIMSVADPRPEPESEPEPEIEPEPEPIVVVETEPEPDFDELPVGAKIKAKLFVLIKKILTKILEKAG